MAASCLIGQMHHLPALLGSPLIEGLPDELPANQPLVAAALGSHCLAASSLGTSQLVLGCSGCTSVGIEWLRIWRWRLDS